MTSSLPTAKRELKTRDGIRLAARRWEAAGNARAAIILGDDELAKGVAQVKDLDSGEQREVALDKLGDVLKG